jgi:serine/threonine-protein kinase
VLARDLADPQLTEGNQFAATPRYAPPEILAGRAPSPAGDVFQLGLVLYEVLTARSDGRTQDVPDVLKGILLREKALAQPAGTEILDRMVRTFVRATAVSPHDRPADARHFLKELDEISAAWLALDKARVSAGKITERPRARSSARIPAGSNTRKERIVPGAPPPAPGPSMFVAVVGRVLTGLALLALVLVVAAVVFIVPQMSGKLGR